MLKQYFDFRANVRYDGKYHSIRQLIQPDDPEIKEIAAVLSKADDFVGAAQDFVDSFTVYKREVGDYWSTPVETLANRGGDCDCLGILLCSILRNYIPAEKVFCAVGNWRQNGTGGHLWVVMESETEADRIIEATASSSQLVKGKYELEAIFNDKYVFAYPQAIGNFDLIPVYDIVAA